MDEVRLIDANALKQKLIEAASSQKGKTRFDKGESWGFEMAAKMVSCISTINPERLRPVTKFTPVDPTSDVEWECAKCGCIISTDWDGLDDFAFCPGCGARIEG